MASSAPRTERILQLSADDLAGVEVQDCVFHQVPKKERGEGELVLSDVCTDLNAESKRLIRAKLIDTLKSKHRFDTLLVHPPNKQASGVIEFLSAEKGRRSDLVMRSKQFAREFFSQQQPNWPEGLLCVLGCSASGGRRALAILKVEHEQGARLHLDGEPGKQTFQIQALRDLIFTKNTKFFKAMLFVKVGDRADLVASAASDSQMQSVAQYWLNFWGCEKCQAGRVQTKSFFDIVTKTVNDSDLAPETKHEVYESLLSELRSNKGAIDVQAFLQDYFEPPMVHVLQQKLKQGRVADHFDKDVQDIQAEIRKAIYRTRAGISLTVPEREASRLTVAAAEIVINDTLDSFGRLR